MKNECNIIIYDKENIMYKKGNCISIDIQSEPVETTSYGDNTRTFIPSMTALLKCEIANYEELNNIELDDTTMKRIAKYNKEIDIKKLDEKIVEKQKKIKELDNILTDRVKRVDKIKKYIANIYDINIDEEDDYYYDD